MSISLLIDLEGLLEQVEQETFEESKPEQNRRLEK